MSSLFEKRLKPRLCALVLLIISMAMATNRCFAQPLSSSNVRSRAVSVSLSAKLRSEVRLSSSEVQIETAVIDPSRPSKIVRVNVKSSWVVAAGTSKLALTGFFTSAEEALTDGSGHRIPATHVLGGVDGERMRPFTEQTPTNGSLTLFQQRISASNVASTREDAINLQLAPIADLGLPAAKYYGTLNLRLISY